MPISGVGVSISRCTITVSAPSSFTWPTSTGSASGSPSMPTCATVKDSSAPPGPHSVSAASSAKHRSQNRRAGRYVYEHELAPRAEQHAAVAERLEERRGAHAGRVAEPDRQVAGDDRAAISRPAGASVAKR